MIKTEFVISDNKILAFSVEGHSGLAPSGEDILCASVSAMTQLVLNTLSEVVKAELDLSIKEDEAKISCRILSVPSDREDTVQSILKGFYIQLCDLAEVYRAYLSVRENNE